MKIQQDENGMAIAVPETIIEAFAQLEGFLDSCYSETGYFSLKSKELQAHLKITKDQIEKLTE